MTTATSCCSGRTCRTPGARPSGSTRRGRTIALVMWFTEAWGAEHHGGACRDARGRADAGARRPRHRLLARRGGSGAADHRDDPRARPGRPAAPPDGGAVAARRRRRRRRRSPARRPTGRRSARPTRTGSSASSTISTPTIASTIAIAALADVAALSPSGFHRLFRRHTRLTVSDYVAELRIGQACALLVNWQQPIAHVADEVGYANLANFNRQFRALKHVTPRRIPAEFCKVGRSGAATSPEGGLRTLTSEARSRCEG